MIFFILILAEHSFGQTSEQNLLNFIPGTMNPDGDIEVDMAGVKKYEDYKYQTSDLDDYRVQFRLRTENDEWFFPIVETKAELEDLATSQQLTPSEQTCQTVVSIHDYRYYGLMGYTIKALKKLDIKPSIIWLLKHNTVGVKYTNFDEDFLSDDMHYFAYQSFGQTCGESNSSNGIIHSLRHSGVVDTSCIPNDMRLEDIVDDSYCVDGETKTKTYLKGFTEGRFMNGNILNVKKLLLRFGAVYSNILDMIIVGWTTESGDEQQRDFWITAEFDKVQKTYKYRKLLADDNSVRLGAILGNPDPNAPDEVDVIKECKQSCIPEVDTPIADCPCYEVDDPREICKKACVPTISTSIDECACYDVGDPREICQRNCVPKEGGGQIRIQLSMIFAAVILPVLMLYN
ncbi:MAG: hypothetical protein EZS28_026840 [Streblomastix strix]|uniref:Uncharacterized protein n=1 Tax=Streblomastix strix TaxID=222440 RepID=A0A5J4V508_9EUKA|nr:MAG: hypothetical protein EZS28_026840 [Streblomastix strix]